MMSHGWLAAAQADQWRDADGDGVALRALDSWFIGGEVVTLAHLPLRQARFAQNGPARTVDPNGDFLAGQMYAQVYRLARPRHPWPVVFWHGGGMTGANWETTPDGRTGWAWRFLQAGFDVVVCDAHERGRASWARFPEIYQEEPLFRSMADAWHMFRFGPADGYAQQPSQRRAHPGQRFPVACLEQFARQWVPRWAGHEEQTLAAYGLLLRRLGRCLLVGHSQGGGFALAAASRWPEHVQAVVALEPSGAPASDGVGAVSALPPHLVVWGDYVAGHPVWEGYRRGVDQHVERLRAGGVPVQIWDLPAQGVAGNSHFPMMDDNSDVLAAGVQRWMIEPAGHGARP